MSAGCAPHRGCRRAIPGRPPPPLWQALRALPGATGAAAVAGELANSSFVDRSDSVLALGLPGTGKTHAMCAVCHRPVEAGRLVLFAPACRLIQDLLAPERHLALAPQLRKLNYYYHLLPDGLG